MKAIKEFLCDDTPTDEEILEAIKIARTKNCIVYLYYPYMGYEYRVTISKDISFEECQKQLVPKYLSM